MERSIFKMEELLDLILSFVKNDSRGGNKATLFAAAQVNSRWLHLALDYLWSDIAIHEWYRFLGLSHQYVSSCSFDETHTNHCSQPLCSRCNTTVLQSCRARVVRFNDFYAPRIRSMFLDLKYYDACEHLLEVLRSFPVFNTPKLEVLKVNIQPTEYNLDLMKKFFHPRLASLSCKISKSPSKNRYPDASEIVDTLEALWLATMVTHFRLRFSMPRFIQAEVFDAFHVFPDLTEVDLPPYLLTANHIASLSNHPKLQRITCITQPTRDLRGGKYNPYDGLSGPIDSVLLFPASSTSTLTHISATAKLSDATSLIMGGFNPDILTSVNIMLLCLEAPGHVLDFTRALSRRCPNLKTFRLSSPEVDNVSAHHTDSRPRMLWDSLRPLCACRAMEDFEIFWHTIIRMNNEEMEELASSWPHLERLVLEGLVPTVEDDTKRCCLSLDCLIALSVFCPSLRELSISLLPILARDRQPKQASSRVLFPHMQSVVFRPGIPPLASSQDPVSFALSPCDAERIARLLFDLFPESCWLSYYCCRTEIFPGVSVLPATLHTFWNAVIAALPDGRCKTREMTEYYIPRYS